LASAKSANKWPVSGSCPGLAGGGSNTKIKQYVRFYLRSRIGKETCNLCMDKTKAHFQFNFGIIAEQGQISPFGKFLLFFSGQAPF
jgi:hypothetical protein